MLPRSFIRIMKSMTERDIRAVCNGTTSHLVRECSLFVDTVDAMIYKRPYNVPVSFREAAAEVRRCAGTQFDPSLVETTLAYLDDHVPPQLK